MKNKRNSVLIIDDEPANIMVLRQILSPEYLVYVATDGQTGLTVAMKQNPDVILLDILMPNMDGYEVLTELRKTVETNRIPVLVVTGLKSEESEEKAFSLGADDYMSKPLNSRILKHRVRNLLKETG